MATLWDASEVDFDSNYPSSPEESSGGEFPDFLTDDSSAATTQVDIPDQNSVSSQSDSSSRRDRAARNVRAASTTKTVATPRRHDRAVLSVEASSRRKRSFPPSKRIRTSRNRLQTPLEATNPWQTLPDWYLARRRKEEAEFKLGEGSTVSGEKTTEAADQPAKPDDLSEKTKTEKKWWEKVSEAVRYESDSRQEKSELDHMVASALQRDSKSKKGRTGFGGSHCGASQPRGRPPKGKTWCRRTGQWVPNNELSPSVEAKAQSSAVKPAPRTSPEKGVTMANVVETQPVVMASLAATKPQPAPSSASTQLPSRSLPPLPFIESRRASSSPEFDWKQYPNLGLPSFDSANEVDVLGVGVPDHLDFNVQQQQQFM